MTREERDRYIAKYDDQMTREELDRRLAESLAKALVKSIRSEDDKTPPSDRTDYLLKRWDGLLKRLSK